mmetsp:Transcript_115692/g.327159  ORF Transcript_115692/g.327159 Transcript_115692/m.327159 type:complete len:265 (+) Transcript_115692:229-1023(+)
MAKISESATQSFWDAAPTQSRISTAMQCQLTGESCWGAVTAPPPLLGVLSKATGAGPSARQASGASTSLSRRLQKREQAAEGVVASSPRSQRTPGSSEVLPFASTGFWPFCEPSALGEACNGIALAAAAARFRSPGVIWSGKGNGATGATRSLPRWKSRTEITRGEESLLGPKSALLAEIVVVARPSWRAFKMAKRSRAVCVALCWRVPLASPCLAFAGDVSWDSAKRPGALLLWLADVAACSNAFEAAREHESALLCSSTNSW